MSSPPEARRSRRSFVAACATGLAASVTTPLAGADDDGREIAEPETEPHSPEPADFLTAAVVTAYPADHLDAAAVERIRSLIHYQRHQAEVIAAVPLEHGDPPAFQFTA